MKHDPDFEKLVESILPKIKEVSTDNVQLASPQTEFKLIDVREKEEWDEGYIPGAIHIGKGVIERDIAKHVHDKSQPLVLYCGGGYRSALAADNLQKMGYTNVKSMAGGIREWKSKGFPLKKDV
ncbi:MAG: sulfurtransferase [Proteobacteria bacterium]|jgi:rhodanese-related sulfurtransferase|nr:sulfurtransferase [Pseudomonadota bacterium]